VETNHGNYEKRIKVNPKVFPLHFLILALHTPTSVANNCF
jgi:hypothetical protein